MIQAQNLTKRFDDFVALDNITCTIPQGCVYGMVGSNGAGKSTFLRAITGVYRPDHGTVLIDGQPIYENPVKKSEIAYVADGLFFLSGANGSPGRTERLRIWVPAYFVMDCGTILAFSVMAR